MYKTWKKGTHLGERLSLDTETTVRPMHETPELVLYACHNGTTSVFILKEDIFDFITLHKTSWMIYHNYPFDKDVLEKAEPRIKEIHTEKEENGTIWDTLLMFQLVTLGTEGFSHPKPSLKIACKTCLEIDIDKESDIRTTFEKYLKTPINDIPSAHLEYAISDTIHTFNLFEHLFRRTQILSGGDGTYLSHHIQLWGAIALNHISKNGVGFDQTKRKPFLEQVNKRLKQQELILTSYGWFRGICGANKVYDELVEYLELDLPKNKTGYSSKAEDLEKYRHEPFIEAYLNFIETEKDSTFVRDIEGDRVYPKYTVIKNTGRTSCSKPNVQQLPRGGDVRSMFTPGKDKVFVITDYSTLELCTLAQICFKYYGKSVMRDMINDGQDIHRYYASVLLGKEPHDITKQERQKAKAANFGFPGGLGVESFCNYARVSYGVDLSMDEAREMRDKWLEAFPEMEQYLKGELGAVKTLTGRLRAKTFYTAEKNTPFQGLAADGAKIALYDADKAGLKVVMFIHDELVTECLATEAESVKELQEKIMIDSMRYVVPDVRISVESQIADFYIK